MKQFAVQFAEARISAGLTHEQAADGICAASYISLIETGRRVPSAEKLKALSERFGTKLELPSDRDKSQALELQLLEASILLDDGKLEPAGQLLKKLRIESSQLELSVKRDIALARLASRQLNYDHAIELLEKFLDGSKTKLVAVECRESAWIEYLRALIESGNLHQAIIRGSELAATELASFSRFAQVTIYAQLAGCHSELGNSAQALKFATNASSIAKILGDPRELARSEWEMAVLLSIEEDTESAARWMKQAIAHAQQAEMRDSLPRMKIAMAAIELEEASADIVDIERELLIIRDETEFNQRFVDVSFASVLLAEIAMKREQFHEASTIVSHAQELLGDTRAGAHVELALLQARCKFAHNADLHAWFETMARIDGQIGHGSSEVVKHWTELARVAIDRGETKLGADAYEHALQAKKRKFADIG